MVRKTAAFGVALTLALCASTASAQTVEGFGELGLRYRGVFVVEGQSSEKLANRPETAFRLGLRAKQLSEHLTVELALASGDPKAPNTHWAAFGEFATGQPIHLDRAFVAIGAGPLPELRLVLGQTPGMWGAGEQIFDEDVSLPGVWIDYEKRADPELTTLIRTRFVGGLAYLFAGEPTGDDELIMWGFQGGATWALIGVDVSVDAGYVDLIGARRLGRAIAREDLRVGARPRGFTANTTDTDDPLGDDAELSRRLVLDGFASDFNMFWGRFEATFFLDEDRSTPLGLDLTVSVNVGDDGPGAGHGLAFDGGVYFGEASAPGEGRVRLGGVFVGADAVLDVFTNDLVGTNAAGARLSGAMILFKGAEVWFDGLVSVQPEGRLRGLGDGRGEPFSDDPLGIQLHVGTRHVF